MENKNLRQRELLAGLILSVLISWILLSMSSCSLFEKNPDSNEKIVKKAAKQRVFYSKYDLVWRAAQTVIRYPLSAVNQETGFIETEFIKSIDGWQRPDGQKINSAGLRYKLIFNFAKGHVDGRESTRVTIEKVIERQRDFFSEPDQIDSDGLEEKVLFYRIERELIINDSLQKAAQEHFSQEPTF